MADSYASARKQSPGDYITDGIAGLLGYVPGYRDDPRRAYQMSKKLAGLLGNPEMLHEAGGLIGMGAKQRRPLGLLGGVGMAALGMSPMASKAAPLIKQAVKGALKELPMDEVSRMARAKDMGFGTDAFHGSPRDIKEFKNKFGSPEGHYGANHYFTSSIDDANHNYAGEGPDLTGRIERVLERNADGGDDYHLRELAQERGLDFDSLSSGEQDQLARDSARAALGIENQGAVYPVKLRMEKPVVVGGKGETHWPYNFETDDAGDFVGESGEAIDLLRHAREAMGDWNVDQRSADDVIAKMGDFLPDNEGVTASQFEDVLRNNVSDLYDDMTGDMASPGALIADIYQRMGHDGVNMDASIFGARKGAMGGRIPGMVGVNDARHYIMFDPAKIRSKFAKFDPKNINSKDILAGVPLAVGGATALSGLLGPQPSQKRREY